MYPFELKDLKIEELRLMMDSLSVYRNLLKDRVIGKLYTLLSCMGQSNKAFNPCIQAYNELFSELARTRPLQSLKSHIINCILFDENLFSLEAEAKTYSFIGDAIKASAVNDLMYLQAISQITPSYLGKILTRSLSPSDFEIGIIERLPSLEFPDTHANAPDSWNPQLSSICQTILSSSSWGACAEALAGFHRKNGCGSFARYKAFIWEVKEGLPFLQGIENSDPVLLADLIGYDTERSEVINNTVRFLNNLPANNILLYGDRGTGKSSTVKAILNEYAASGLRVIEVPKANLIDFPQITRKLKDRKQKFIIFVDDLAFEDNEENYTALKAVLEGGLESKPENVLVYATSNRRHLIKEKFSDRSGLYSGNAEDEVRSADSIQEKLSLADRFGITVVFSSPDKSRYLQIVEGIALKRGIKIDKEKLHKEALKWELWYNGRSPRTARQFMDWFEGQVKNPGL